jgi:4'-phosphopantetheinyl transferase
MTKERHRNATLASVQLWRVDLDVRAEVEEEFHSELSAKEIQKAGDIASPSLRRRYIIARGTLRELVGSLLDERPRSIPIDAGPSGKPHIVGTEHGLHFNVSHSGDLAMICIADCGEVGVDVETVRHVPAAIAIAKRRFAPAEARFVEQDGLAGADGRFLLCWTRKEALVKAMGTGMSFDLRGLTVPLTSPSGIVAIQGRKGGPAKRWLLLDVPLCDGFVAAMALPASVMRHGVGPNSGFARVPSASRLDHCEEIDVRPLVSRALKEYSPSATLRTSSVAPDSLHRSRP